MLYEFNDIDDDCLWGWVLDLKRDFYLNVKIL